MKIKMGLCALLTLLSFNTWSSERSERAWEQVEQGALLIDVRTVGEFNQGHLDGATNTPLNSVTTAFSTIEKDTPIVVYCRSGARSGKAMSDLKAMGFTHVYNGGGLTEMQSTKPTP